ncbi:outer membrane protein assembly factor BamA [Fimbriiglobus ruber]|uniref:Outer membrane protein assembly factor BamA n=1 Tax=Fimbriiglobus ruber TaxID=1908690 RepID=A0A225E016_9BACT|nr:outer membrane protein assembly factor BamA [Fimbriiglobus ruber]OWK46892.1 Outer membrane protein assembly factor YaeT precursor [Fimbriiglobus ruber]
MIARRPFLGRIQAFVVLAVVAAVGGVWCAAPGARAAEETPFGKIVADVIPVNNKIHDKQTILSQMKTKAGAVYDPNTVDADVRQLMGTRWFAPGGVRVSTIIGADNRVTVFVHVLELNNIVNEVVYIGQEHLSESELRDLTHLRKGSPLNPTMNQLAAQEIQNKLREEGRAYATVILLEGDKLADTRVVFQITEGPVVRLRGVDFRGNAAADSGRLKTVVVSTGPMISGFITPLTAKFNQAMVEEDKKRLVKYYYRLGHLDAQVHEEVVPYPNDVSQVTVVYHVDEGRAYTVGSVKIEGNKLVSDARLRKVIETKPGEKYNLDAVQADEQRLKNLEGNGGVNAIVEHAWFAVPDKPGVVDVHYRLMEPSRGEPDRVGRIIIEGNTITAQRVIMNQLGLYPGQVLQYPKLKQAEANLSRLGIFDGEDPPTVEVIPSDFDSIYKDIRVRVKETRTGMAALTATVNSDAGVNGSITLNQRNFDILRVPTSLDDLFAGKAFRGGGQEMQIQAMPGTTFQRYAITWREPYLYDTRFGLTISGSFFERQYTEYTEERTGLRATVDYRFAESPIWKTTMSARLEDVDVKNIPYWASNAITSDAGHATQLGLRAGLNRDTRDSYLLPTSGSVFDIGFEQLFGSYYEVPIGTTELSQYYTMYQRKDGSGKQVLALRTQATVMGANAPVFERAFAGGFRSMRGFTFRGVGPYENDLNIGGTFAFLNTVEYQIPVMANDKLWFVMFCDHGTVERTVTITDYRVAVGAGMRIVIPAMGPLPIALDFAVPVHQAAQDQKQLFSFYVGWFGGQ